jgi:two-component system sensor histidine kinase YesM
MDPHFLFNSLEAIRMCAQLRRDNEVADALVALSSVLRMRINAGGKATIEQELSIVRNYVIVENIRFNNRIMLDVDVADALLAKQVPS